LQTVLGHGNLKISWPSEGNNWEKKWVGIFYATWISNHSLLRTSPPFVWSYFYGCVGIFFALHNYPISAFLAIENIDFFFSASVAYWGENIT